MAVGQRVADEAALGDAGGDEGRAEQWPAQGARGDGPVTTRGPTLAGWLAARPWTPRYAPWAVVGGEGDGEFPGDGGVEYLGQVRATAARMRAAIARPAAEGGTASGRGVPSGEDRGERAEQTAGGPVVAPKRARGTGGPPPSRC